MVIQTALQAIAVVQAEAEVSLKMGPPVPVGLGHLDKEMRGDKVIIVLARVKIIILAAAVVVLVRLAPPRLRMLVALAESALQILFQDRPSFTLAVAVVVATIRRELSVLVVMEEAVTVLQVPIRRSVVQQTQVVEVVVLELELTIPAATAALVL